MTAGAAFLADHPGALQYEWFGATGTLSTSEALVYLVVGFAALIFVLELLRSAYRAPTRIAERAKQRRREKAWSALSDGLVAVAAGDVKRAEKAAADARRLAPDEKLTALLDAQVAQLLGNPAAATERFLAMTHAAETQTLGLRGLSVEAARSGDLATARGHARAANAVDPSLPWAAAAAFDASTAERDWAAALKLNDDAQRHRLVDRAVYRRRKAVLLMGRAEDALHAGDTERARIDALEAHQLAPSLVPAATLAARLTAARGKRQATAIIDETTRLAPHPELFAVALDIADPHSAGQRLKRAEALAGLAPGNVESALALARAARIAHAFDRARAALFPFLDGKPTQRVCIAMAEIEAADTGDEIRVRDWLARAVRAPRDPAWVADGVVADHWQPISPVTGALDRFAWTVPDGDADRPGPTIDLTGLTERLPAPEARHLPPAPRASVPGAGSDDEPDRRDRSEPSDPLS
nr:heme biosynthesis HemY N-terminal domain-containing protein [Acuticoccus kalidii]